MSGREGLGLMAILLNGEPMAFVVGCDAVAFGLPLNENGAMNASWLWCSLQLRPLLGIEVLVAEAGSFGQAFGVRILADPATGADHGR